MTASSTSRRARGSREPLRTTVHQYFAPHRHSALLAAIIAAFVARPLIGESGAGFLVFSVALVLLLLVALYNINIDEMVGEKGVLLTQARHRRLLGWILAAATGGERLVSIVAPGLRLDMIGAICWLLFVVFVTAS